MKKLTLSMLIIVLLSNLINGQSAANDDLIKSLKTSDGLKEGWNSQGQMNIGLAQGHLENWAAGGEINSFNVNALLNGFKTKVKKNTIWENTYNCSYGLNYLQSNDFVPLKTDDRFDLSSRYGFKTKEKSKWYWTALGRVQSQFTKGYNYSDSIWKADKRYAINNAEPISQLFSPGYVTLALGVQYIPNKNFSVFFSPLASKMTFIAKKFTLTKSNFGVEQGKTFRFELGTYSTLQYTTKLSENVDYRTRLDIYMNYLDKMGIGNVDILWDNVLALKVNKYIGVAIGATIVYDNDIPGKITKDTNGDGNADALGSWGWTQLKQVLNVGFSYKF